LIFNLLILESERQECVKLDFISPLKDPLKSGSIQEKIESCRAIGNMCYENGLKFFFKFIPFFKYFI
jgi:hypothetical protein